MIKILSGLLRRFTPRNDARSHVCTRGLACHCEERSDVAIQYTTKAGAVLIFSLLSMGIITVLTQQLMKSVSVGIMFTSRMVIREQVKMFAYGGLSIATAQLDQCYPEENKKDKAAGVQPSADQQASQGKQTKNKFSFKTFITTVLPHLGRWQTFELTDKIDGIDAKIQVCITVEEGKIPFGSVFDEPARDLTAQMKQLFKEFIPKKKMAAGEFATKLTAALKQRATKMQEISGLLLFAQQAKLELWYQPQELPRVKKDKPVPATYALQDMFTFWSQSSTMNPLFLTNALCLLCTVRGPQANDATSRKDQYKQLAENYEKIKSSKGDELWKNLGVLYETKPKLTGDFNALFSLEVEPRFYSVLSCATVAGVTQQILAIVERVAPPVQAVEKRGQEQKKKKDVQPLFAIRRLYWL
ncbi:MAG: hypothetical protein QG604_843 [Candidatus Dependentiae bacterium]|nr:hypothetical protein [Candidatus Dependentiae bacterium]